MSQRPIHIDLAPTDAANINAEDDAFWIAGMLGATGNAVSGILPIGGRMAISKTSDNEVVLQSGAFAMQGFVISIPDAESFTIASGVQGKKRLDLIVAEYIKGTPRSSYQLKVVQGTQGDDYVTPSLTTQDLHAGGTTRQEAIAQVKLNGIDIVEQTIVTTTFKGLTDLFASIQPAALLTAIKTVDGAGSGLDADLLDGKHGSYYATTSHNHDTVYLGINAQAADSAKLAGYSAQEGSEGNTIVKRSSAGNVYATSFNEGGTWLYEKYLGINAQATDSAKLNGQAASYYAVATHNHDSVYLGINAQAADSAKLGGQLPNAFAPANILGTFSNRVWMNAWPAPASSGPESDLADITNSCFYFGYASNKSGYPSAYGSIFGFRFSQNSWKYSWQIFSSSQGALYLRRGLSATEWSPWSQICDMANTPPTLYGTGNPPSSLLPGQIYIQY
jgi:hypothetical protein